MGWVTPLGYGLDTVWKSLLNGESAIGPIELFDGATFDTNFAAQVRGFKLEEHLADTSAHKHAHRHVGFALAAANQAWQQSRIGADPSYNPRRVGVYLGSGEGALDFANYVGSIVDAWDEDNRAMDTSKWAELAFARKRPNMEIGQEPQVVLAHLAREFPVRGPAFNCMTACAASTQSVGEAYEMIKRGDVDAMLAGGSHTMIHPLGMTGFIRLTAMSTRRDSPETAARPFDRTRDGFVMGEGAGMIVLESLENAERRGAEPLAELVGYGSSADAYRITDIQPDGGGASACMTAALKQAGINPREPDSEGRPPVQYISAHGTGTPENDGIETRAVKDTFGTQAPSIPFTSVKSMMGHLIQAAGAVELITCVQSIKTGWVPPTINLHEPDPVCDLDHVPNEARDMNPLGGVDVALSNGFGFGGQNDCVCVRRFVD